ncbi:P-loop containing nucleoside triphosphate hydrolase protein [Meira miltonrushii]|uniref:P-loop containing nucleoside triphosphate hydrolase protein n=1 Tax=Meira miltonrushii TaxID=1280837 RepID=A0A316V2F1_9BASI|nr:P-loop containing nucleoside triphosphate hydrolase protein [Meira miltonrushii]PWN31690.1 P-loop containing nucleoside triphosphate hydrolase protein [Meira miltonrushii]
MQRSKQATYNSADRKQVASLRSDFDALPPSQQASSSRNPFGKTAVFEADENSLGSYTDIDRSRSDPQPLNYHENDGFEPESFVAAEDWQDEQMQHCSSNEVDAASEELAGIQEASPSEDIQGKAKEVKKRRSAKTKETKEDEPLFGRGQQRRAASKTVLNGGMTQQDKLDRKNHIESVALRDGVLSAQAETKALKKLDAQRRQRRKTHLLTLQPYIERNMRLIDLEAEEERKTVELQRTWSDARLRLEGVMIQGLEGYWLQASASVGLEDELTGFSKTTSAPSQRTAVFHRPGKAKLGWTKIQKGDQLSLRAEKSPKQRSAENTDQEGPTEEEGVIGTVRNISEFELRIVFREPPADLDLLSSSAWRVDLAYNDTIEERLRASVEAVAHDVDATQRAGAELSGTHLVDVLLDQPKKKKGTDVDSTAPLPITEWIRQHRPTIPAPNLSHLTTSQREAVELMLGERISLIQGPPGTGKTSTIVAALKVLKHHYEIPHPILLTSHTNVAVDNLAQGCKETGLNVVRAGPTARVREAIMDITLEGRMEKHPSKGALDRTEAQRVNTVLELQKAQRFVYSQQNKGKQENAQKRKNDDDLADRFHPSSFDAIVEDDIQAPAYDAGSITRLKQKLSRLIQRAYLIRRNIETDIFAEADVVCCTALSAPLIHAIDFPLVFFDEATMATEPITLATITKGCQQLSLIGDHKQLSPLIRSREAQTEGLGESMFERLMERGDLKSVMLDTQHRMHPSLAAFSGEEFYDGKLKDGAKTSKMVPLQSSFAKEKGENANTGFLTFVHHNGRESLAKSKSLENEAEAEIVVSIVADLLAKNEDLHGSDIAILTPYAGQRQLIARSLLEPSSALRKLFTRQLELRGGQAAKARVRELPRLEIETIDGFEGREKRAIVFSMVRNNAGRFWGFLTEHKRWNVALTRARNGMWIVGSMSMLEQRAPWEDIATITRQATELVKASAGTTNTDADEEDGIDDAINRITWKPQTGDHAGFITRFASHLRRNECVINAKDMHTDAKRV